MHENVLSPSTVSQFPVAPTAFATRYAESLTAVDAAPNCSNQPRSPFSITGQAWPVTGGPAGTGVHAVAQRLMAGSNNPSFDRSVGAPSRI
jgi:hypothetical protein